MRSLGHPDYKYTPWPLERRDAARNRELMRHHGSLEKAAAARSAREALIKPTKPQWQKVAYNQAVIEGTACELLGERKFDPNVKLFRASAYLLIGAAVTANYERITEMTGYMRCELVHFSMTARRYRIMDYRRIAVERWDGGGEASGAFQFVLDAMLICGSLIATSIDRPLAEWTYQNAEEGDAG